MKSNYDPVTQTSPDDVTPAAWESLVDKTATTKVWVCLVCHAALAAGQTSHARKHIEWHGASGGS